MEEKLDEASDLNKKSSDLSQTEYSSEFFKIELKNLPNSFGFGVY